MPITELDMQLKKNKHANHKGKAPNRRIFQV